METAFACQFVPPPFSTRVPAFGNLHRLKPSTSAVLLPRRYRRFVYGASTASIVSEDSENTREPSQEKFHSKGLNDADQDVGDTVGSTQQDIQQFIFLKAKYNYEQAEKKNNVEDIKYWFEKMEATRPSMNLFKGSATKDQSTSGTQELEAKKEFLRVDQYLDRLINRLVS